MLDDYHRGSADFDPLTENYSYQITSIEPGLIIEGCNFAQATPNTQAIICDGPVTFLECNLTNCALDPRWTVLDCNTGQSWFIPPDGRVFIARHPDELTGFEVAPDGAIV